MSGKILSSKDFVPTILFKSFLKYIFSKEEWLEFELTKYLTNNMESTINGLDLVKIVKHSIYIISNIFL